MKITPFCDDLTLLGRNSSILMASAGLNQSPHPFSLQPNENLSLLRPKHSGACVPRTAPQSASSNAPQLLCAEFSCWASACHRLP